MQKPLRIALVVDNPFRDLPALVLVATKLCQVSIKCYLVPFNLCNKELQYLLPDFVLLNYVRKNNESFVKFLNSLGIKVGILETEGIFNQIPSYSNSLLGNGTNVGATSDYDEFFVTMANDKETRDGIDCYCAWNNNFAEYLKVNKWFKPENVIVTGLPRTDLFHSKWKILSLSIVPYINSIAQPMVLINSSFPFVSPQFQSTEQEIKMMVKVFHYSEKYIKEWIEIEKTARNLFIELTNALVKEFSEINFVYRPHPFENENQYKELLVSKPNLHIIRKGTLDGWLHHSSALIHYRNCTTNIEAGLAGIPVLTADWLPVHKHMPILENISISVPDLNTMKQHIQSILSKTFIIDQSIHANIEKTKLALYNQVDGLSFQRVAQAIIDSISKSPKHININKVKKWLYLHIQNPKGFLSVLLVKIRIIMRISIHWSFKRFRLIYERDLPWDKSPKAFRVDDIKKMVDCIQLHTPGIKKISVHPASSSTDYNLGYMEGRSVVMQVVK